MKKTWTGVLIAAALLLAGCGNGGATGPTGTPSTSSAVSTSASPTTTATPTTSPEDAAAAQAEEVLRAYYLTQTTCLSDPQKTELTCFDHVATGTALNDLRNTLISAKTMATRESGNIEVVSAQRTQVDLRNDRSKNPPVVPQVAFRACIDVRKLNLVDKDGKSIVPPGRKPRSVGSVVVANYKYPDPTQWRVAYVVPEKDATC